MKKILITGALGQIGTELTSFLSTKYGNQQIVASDIKTPESKFDVSFEICDVTNKEQIENVCKKHEINYIVHLAAILSAVGELKPELLWDINMNGLINILNVAKDMNCAVFVPSSIAVFGSTTPSDNTPQTTIQRPSTMYGISKVAGELLCDYYHEKFGVDTRGVRFPGLISNAAMPGGGTTDYAVHIYYEALNNKKYTSYIAEGTYMDMMYMPDALEAIYSLMEADGEKLKNRNAYNITAMSFSPEEIGAEIKKHVPDFELIYEVDPMRQKIAESWPNSLDDSIARKEWGFNPKYDLEKMTEDMLLKLTSKK